MLNFLIECILLSIAAGTSAAVYYAVLRYEWPVNLMSGFFNKHEGKGWTKPLWACNKCIAGQLSLWSYVLLKLLQHDQNPINSVLGLIFTICMGIFVAMIFTRILTNIQN